MRQNLRLVPSRRDPLVLVKTEVFEEVVVEVSRGLAAEAMR